MDDALYCVELRGTIERVRVGQIRLEHAVVTQRSEFLIRRAEAPQVGE